MTGPATDDDPPDDEPSEATERPSEPTLDELRFVGPASADVLREAAIDAASIVDREVTFVDLVAAGVEPGVAGRLRREYSLQWSDEPTTGARLRRRAEHVKHLREDERSWIAASRSADREPEGSNAATPDGSGDANEAEQAWRDRSRPPEADRPRGETTWVFTGGELVVPADLTPPVDPADHTVPELEEAIASLEDPIGLGAVLLAEREGDDRTTAVAAVEARLDAVGVDPDDVTVVRDDGRPATEGLREATSSFQQTMQRDVVEPLAERFDASLDRARATAAEARQASDRFGTSFVELDAEEWGLLARGLLVGFVAYALSATVVAALQPSIGPPLAALPLLLVTAALAVVALSLSWWEAPGADGFALAAGLLGVLGALAVFMGLFGLLSSAAAAVTVAAFGLLAAAQAATTHLGRTEPWVPG